MVLRKFPAQFHESEYREKLAKGLTKRFAGCCMCRSCMGSELSRTLVKSVQVVRISGLRLAGSETYAIGISSLKKDHAVLQLCRRSPFTRLLSCQAVGQRKKDSEELTDLGQPVNPTDTKGELTVQGRRQITHILQLSSLDFRI